MTTKYRRAKLALDAAHASAADHARNAAELRAENEKLRQIAIAMAHELMRVNEIMLAECGNGLVNLHLLEPIRKHLS